MIIYDFKIGVFMQNPQALYYRDALAIERAVNEQLRAQIAGDKPILITLFMASVLLLTIAICWA